MEIGTGVEEIVIEDTAAGVGTMTTVAESVSTKEMVTMIRAANEGISLSTTALVCWVGSFASTLFYPSSSG